MFCCKLVVVFVDECVLDFSCQNTSLRGRKASVNNRTTRTCSEIRVIFTFVCPFTVDDIFGCAWSLLVPTGGGFLIGGQICASSLWSLDMCMFNRSESLLDLTNHGDIFIGLKYIFGRDC